MENIFIEDKEKPFLPKVSFNASSGECLIEGDSYMENAFEFYEKLTAWIEAFCAEKQQTLTLAVKLKYFNTSSSKCLLDFFKSVKRVKDNGGNIEVSWYYPDPDSSIFIDGEDFVFESELDMEFIEYDE